MTGAIRAIVALGNPGAGHASERHNAGFWLADALADRWHASLANDRRSKGELARFGSGNDRLWLLKPMTYMNLSGEAVAPLCAFYKIDAEQVLVVHDDLDLPAGAARFKQSGGHGGHNGLRDITRVLGPTYKRLRLGVGHPGHRDGVLSHVLSKPAAAEREAIEAAIGAGIAAIETVIADGWNRGAQQLNTRAKQAN